MTYNVRDVACFFSKTETPDLWLLSNMAGGMPIEYKGIHLNSSEQLYQAYKYHPDTECIPGALMGEKNVEPGVRQRIITANNPRGAKMTQECAVKAGLVRADWGAILIDCMRWVLELKLQQNCLDIRQSAEVNRRQDDCRKVEKRCFWGLHPIRANT